MSRVVFMCRPSSSNAGDRIRVSSQFARRSPNMLTPQAVENFTHLSFTYQVFYRKIALLHYFLYQNWLFISEQLVDGWFFWVWIIQNVCFHEILFRDTLLIIWYDDNLIVSLWDLVMSLHAMFTRKSFEQAKPRLYC